MRLSSAAIIMVAVLAMGSAPAAAAGLSGIGAAIFGNSFSFKQPNVDKVPVKAIRVGKLQVSLQRTKLKDIQKVFGGTLQSQGDGSTRATWLCYNTGSANVWFISNALGGFEFVMMVAAEQASKPAAGCEAAPAGFAAPDFGIPSLGASTADLKKVFGNASGGKVSYRFDRPGGYSNIAQYLGYLLKSGRVIGIGVGETSVPTQH